MPNQPFSCIRRAVISGVVEDQAPCQYCNELAHISLLDRLGVDLEMMGKVQTISGRYIKVRTHGPLDRGMLVQIDCGDSIGLGEVVHASPGDGSFVCVVRIKHGLNKKTFGGGDARTSVESSDPRGTHSTTPFSA
jgi:hypothetical protein